MTENEIREPIQKRSIEKKEKIIKAGFELICKNGYYNTNTAEIAKAAGVSTGIVYNYFKDKHDIFIDGLKIYADDIFYPMLNLSTQDFNSTDIKKVLTRMIDSFIENHKLSQSAHEEIMSMTHSDKEVAYFFNKREIEMTLFLTNLLIDKNFNKNNLIEKVHICIGIIDNLCHEIVYHKHEIINYEIMKTEVINVIINILK